MKTPIAARPQLDLWIVVILFMAAALRLIGIAWGLPDPQYSSSTTALGRTNAQVIVHPDAFHFAARSYVMVARRDLNPHFFENPSFYIDLNVLLHLLSGDTAQYPPLDPKIDLRQAAPFTVYPMARLLSALAGMLGVAFIYGTARLIADKPTARMAALLLAVAFADVQHAHYATTNVLAGALLCGSLWASVRLLRMSPRRRDYLLAGAFVGLAGSTKYNVGLGIILFVVCAAFAYRRDRDTLRNAVLGLLAVGVGFWIGTPYALFAPRVFLHDFQYITSQYVGGQGYPETSEAFPLYLVYWAVFGVGLVAAAFTVPGIWAFWSARRPRTRQAGASIAAFLVVYAFVVLRGRRLGDHLIAPILGIMSILAAAGFVWLCRRVRLRPILAAGGALMFIAMPLAYSVYFDRMLTLPDTRQLAQAWIYAHVPRGAHVHLTGPYNVPLDSADYISSQTFSGDYRPLNDIKEARGASVLVVSDAIAFLFNNADRVIPGPYANQQNEYERQVTTGWKLVARFDRPRWPGDDNIITTANYFHNPTISIYCLDPGCNTQPADDTF